MAEITDILTEKKEIQLERHDEMRAMKSEIEAHLKEMMQEKMNELELKVDNKIAELTKDLDGIKANLHAQTERLTNCEMQLKGVSDVKTMPMFEEMRGEFEKMKWEQTRLALKAKEDSEIIYTTKGRADVLIQLLEQKDERMIKEMNEHKTKMDIMMDAYKNQMEEVKTKIASVDWGKEPGALEQMESKIFETKMKDLQNQYEWLGIMKHLRKDERSREMDQTKLNGTGLVQKVEKMEVQMQKDGAELQLNMDNQMPTINEQLETIDNRVNEHENKLTSFDNKLTAFDNILAAFDNKVTVIGNEVATIENKVTTDDNEIIINDNLITIEKKMDDTDKRITTTEKTVETIDKRITKTEKMVETIDKWIKTTDKTVETIDKRITTTAKKVDATDSHIADIYEKVSESINRLTWMENWQKKLKNLGIFGTLRRKDGCQVSEFSFTVNNIEAEITRARDNSQHRIESQPFYTSIMGYRAKLRVYPDARNTNHVDAYLVLVAGEFDDLVSWPFNCKYQLHSVSRDGTRFASIFVDPSTSRSNQNAFSKPYKSTGYRTEDYITSEKLPINKDQYMIEGGLSIKATIWLSN